VTRRKRRAESKFSLVRLDWGAFYTVGSPLAFLFSEAKPPPNQRPSYNR
jgi:hypothetical protein